jgi:hypothetical protein
VGIVVIMRTTWGRGCSLDMRHRELRDGNTVGMYVKDGVFLTEERQEMILPRLRPGKPIPIIRRRSTDESK